MEDSSTTDYYVGHYTGVFLYQAHVLKAQRAACFSLYSQSRKRQVDFPGDNISIVHGHKQQDKLPLLSPFPRALEDSGPGQFCNTYTRPVL